MKQRLNPWPWILSLGVLVSIPALAERAEPIRSEMPPPPVLVRPFAQPAAPPAAAEPPRGAYRVIAGLIVRRGRHSILVEEPRTARRFAILRSALNKAYTPHRGDAVILQVESQRVREIR